MGVYCGWLGWQGLFLVVDVFVEVVVVGLVVLIVEDQVEIVVFVGVFVVEGMVLWIFQVGSFGVRFLLVGGIGWFGYQVFELVWWCVVVQCVVFYFLVECGELCFVGVVFVFVYVFVDLGDYDGVDDVDQYDYGEYFEQGEIGVVVCGMERFGLYGIILGYMEWIYGIVLVIGCCW